MDICDIRPHSKYLGHDGLVREVRAVVMDLDGVLHVDWRSTAIISSEAWAKKRNYERLDVFAQWAQTIIETHSKDLQHFMDAQLREGRQCNGGDVSGWIPPTN